MTAPIARRLAAVIAAALAAAACARPSVYAAPVTTFRDASAVVIESTQAYLIALNKTEREHYVNDRVASQAPIQLIRIEEVQVFGAEAIAARLDALDQLADYTELLYQLATSDAPDTIKGRAKSLNTALTHLSGEIAQLRGADDAGFKKASDTVLPIIGDVLQAVVAEKIEDALRKAAAAGAAPVNTLIEAIKIDAEVAYERKRNVLSKRRADVAVAYNTEAAKGDKASASALRRLADAVLDTEDQWETFKTARPVTGLDAMQQANLALEAFARTRRPGIRDFATFVDAMEAFAGTAARVGEAVRHLKELQDRGAR